MSKTNNPFENINTRLDKIHHALEMLQSKVERNPSDPDALVSINGACELLGISRQTLWSWEKRGLIQPVYMGSIKRYKRGELLGIAR